ALAESGIGRGAAIANIKAMASALADLGRSGSEIRQSLLRQTTDPQAMAALLQRLTGFASAGDLKGAVNAVMEAYNNVVENEFKRSGDRVRAAARGTGFLAELKLSPEMVIATQRAIRNLSDEQVAALERAADVAAKFNVQWERTNQLVDRVTTGIQVELMGAMTEFNDQIGLSGEAWGKTIGKEITQTIKDLKDAYNEIKAIVEFLKAKPEDVTRRLQEGQQKEQGIDWLRRW